MISDFFNMALKNIRKRKLRAFLTLVGITISIATIFVLVSVSLGLSASIEEQFESLGADKFFVQPRGQFGPPGSSSVGAQLTQKDVDAIEKVQGVKAVSFWVIGNARIEYRNEIRFVQIAGMELSDPELSFSTLKIEDGRLLDNSDSKNIVVGSQYKHNNFVGSAVSLRDKIEINGVEFRVVGILETAGNPPDDRIIYMPEKDFRELFNISERIDFIMVQVNERGDVNAIAENVEKRLMKSRGVNEKTIDFTILTPEELLESIGVILNIVTVFLIGVASISLIVGGINISNTMFTSVLERTKEIGVMKAIGAKNSNILSVFLIESGLLGLIGGLFGISLGYVAAKTIEYIATVQLATTLLQVSTPFYLFAGCLFFAFFAGSISGFWPAWKATKISPVEALRYE